MDCKRFLQVSKPGLGFSKILKFCDLSQKSVTIRMPRMFDLIQQSVSIRMPRMFDLIQQSVSIRMPRCLT